MGNNPPKQTKPKYHLGQDVLGHAVVVWKTALDPKIIDLLAQHGGDINASDQHGDTLLHIACWLRHSSGVIEALLKNGANTNALKGKETPMTHGFLQKKLMSNNCKAFN